MDVAPTGSEHEWFSSQVSKGDGFPSSKAMRRWRNSDPCILSNQYGIAVRSRVEDDAEVEGSGLKPDLDLPIIRFKRNQFNAWMQGSKATQERRQHSGENAGKGRDPNGTDFLAGSLGGLFPDRVQMRQGSAGMVKRSFPKSSKLDTTRDVEGCDDSYQ
ncbi:hypothetical protein SAMN03159422_04528 [Agrobacterium fabrum]|nr:hypothetical protein SRABI46_03824 [Agrobacterium fabrum]CAH0276039.1 hypothetical protein SRABI05_03648 [Agrobacterium fabrum]SDB72586.1 hypothetical protein SAMN03159422_04528 [Agrobacterium fabrum]SES03179.1 hypothetical protein SAMN03159504_04391 [Agrobacterium fabrum]